MCVLILVTLNKGVFSFLSTQYLFSPFRIKQDLRWHLVFFFPFAVGVCVYVWVYVCICVCWQYREVQMVGCGSLSDCGEECEIQLSASHHPPGSDLMWLWSPSGSISLWQTPYCFTFAAATALTKKKEKSRILLIKADIPLRMFGSRSLPLIKLLLSLFTWSRVL